MENDAKSKVDFAVLFGQQQNSMGKQLASQANSQALEIQEERKDVDELHAKSMQMNMAYHQAKSEFVRHARLLIDLANVAYRQYGWAWA